MKKGPKRNFFRVKKILQILKQFCANFGQFLEKSQKKFSGEGGELNKSPAGEDSDFGLQEGGNPPLPPPVPMYVSMGLNLQPLSLRAPQRSF